MVKIPPAVSLQVGQRSLGLPYGRLGLCVPWTSEHVAVLMSPLPPASMQLLLVPGVDHLLWTGWEGRVEHPAPTTSAVGVVLPAPCYLTGLSTWVRGRVHLDQKGQGPWRGQVLGLPDAVNVVAVSTGVSARGVL